MKLCSICNSIKPLDQYYIDKRRGKPGSRCKPCGLEYNKEWRRRHPEFGPKRYQADKLNTRERHLVRKYGVNLTQYDEMFAAQGGACAICGRKQDRAFDVDHCHATGTVRGLLCTNCNRMIGHAGDDAPRLRAAAAYLEGTRP